MKRLREHWFVLAGVAGGVIIVASLGYAGFVKGIEDLVKSQVDQYKGSFEPDEGVREALSRINAEIVAQKNQSAGERKTFGSVAFGTGTDGQLMEKLNAFAVEIAIIQDRLDGLEAHYPPNTRDTFQEAEDSDDQQASKDPLTGGPPGSSQNEEDEALNLEKLQADLISEAEDPVWAHGITADIKTAVEDYNRVGEDSLTNLVDVDCRTTRCRVVVESSDGAQAGDLALMFAEQFGEEIYELSSSTETYGSGRTETTYFLGKQRETASDNPNPQ